MKKIKYLILLILPCLILTGCDNGDNNTTENKNIIEELSIEEGCYSTDNSENLMCLTKDLKYYNVLYKNSNYYQDPYYLVSPPTEKETENYKFETENGIITIELYSNGEIWQSLVCSASSENTIDCTEMSTVGGKVEKVEKHYTKVEKDFSKDIIEKLPIYERNKEYEIDFNGEQITCNFTRSYSIVRANAGGEIAKCLTSKYDEEYVVTQLDSSDSWQIYTKKISEDATKIYGRIESSKYLIENYSYNVTVNDTSFKYFKDFPIDPYNTNEKLIVSISK